MDTVAQVKTTDSTFVRNSRPIQFIVNRMNISDQDRKWITEVLIPQLEALGDRGIVLGRATASPEGPYDNNCRLAKGRRASVDRLLGSYGISKDGVELWGTGTPLREFLWSEEMADASVFIMEHVDFKDTYRPGSKEIRNCHINIGTGKEISIAGLAHLIVKETGYKGSITFNPEKPDGTMRKLTDVTKLHELGWHHKIDIEEGVHKMYQWYLEYKKK